MHVEILQGSHSFRYGGDGGNPHVLDEHVLGCSGAALHAVDHHGIGAGLDCQGCVVEGSGGAYLDEDRNLPVDDLAQLVDLDLEVVGTGPIGVAAG